MMMNSDVLTSDDDISARSDQLPSVEEARMNAEASRRQSNASWSKGSDVETAFSGSQDGSLPAFNGSEHDQLPSVEDVRMHAGRSGSGKGKLKLFLVAALVIIGAIAVAVTLVVTKTGTEEQEFPMEFNSNAEGNVYDDAPAEPLGSVPAATDPPTAAPLQQVTTPPPTEPLVTPSPATRYGKLVQLLSTHDISKMEDLVRTNSPQQKAATWMANQDPLALDLESPDMDAIKQRYVLTTMFYALGGQRWSNKMNFLTGNHECQWFVKAFAGDQKTIRQYGVTCNKSNTVQELRFPSTYLSGAFPAELSHLADLERLDAFNNKGLTGGFPDFFRGLTKISYIGLHYCDLTGTLPTWLGDLTSLKSLVLSNNEFSGVLPTSLSNLVNLEDLYLDDNQLGGGISMLNGLSNLKNLVLEDNQFEGSLDGAMVASWGQLEALDVSHNNLDSRIPASIFTLPKLRILDLHGNQFNGALPKFSVTETALEILTLNENELSGEIPSELGLCVNLKLLDVSGNGLSSTIPSTLGNLASLEYLYMAQNPFAEADIPASFSGLSSLKELSLKSTKRTGDIPDWIGSLSSLVLLDLDDNALTGTIPATIGNLSNLRYLLLNRNKLEGPLPATLSSLSNLAFFMIEKNNILGSAEGVCNLSATREMFVADCDGATPQVSCSCCNVCCADGDEGCNDQIWLGDSNPIWELGYFRQGPIEFDAAASRSYTVKFSGDIP